MRAVTKTELKNWLIDNISKASKLSRDSISLDEPVASYGLDSLQSVILSGDLEEWLNIEIEPTLFWDHPTINKISDFIIDSSM